MYGRKPIRTLTVLICELPGEGKPTQNAGEDFGVFDVSPRLLELEEDSYALH
jgi:hypothetical protein